MLQRSLELARAGWRDVLLGGQGFLMKDRNGSEIENDDRVLVELWRRQNAEGKTFVSWDWGVVVGVVPMGGRWLVAVADDGGLGTVRLVTFESVVVMQLADGFEIPEPPPPGTPKEGG